MKDANKHPIENFASKEKYSDFVNITYSQLWSWQLLLINLLSSFQHFQKMAANTEITEKTLFIKGISMTDDQLSLYFSKFGTVARVYTRDSFGFVTIATDNHKRIIDSLNGTTWRNQKIRIEYAKPAFLERLKNEWAEAPKLAHLEAVRKAKRIKKKQTEIMPDFNHKKSKVIGEISYPIFRVRLDNHLKIMDPAKFKKISLFPITEECPKFEPIQIDFEQSEKARKRRGSWTLEELEAIKAKAKLYLENAKEIIEFEDEEIPDNMSLFNSDDDDLADAKLVDDAFLDQFNTDSD